MKIHSYVLSFKITFLRHSKTRILKMRVWLVGNSLSNMAEGSSSVQPSGSYSAVTQNTALDNYTKSKTPSDQTHIIS